MTLARLALLITAAMATGACSDRARSGTFAPATTIDTIGDTIRVRTGPGAAPVLRLEPEVRIAEVEGDEAYQLARVAVIVEGPAGGIYVWDERLSDLRLFDSAGTFVRKLGRHGQGPGEYVDASGIAAAPGGDVVVWDPQSARFTVFTPDGTVRTSWRWQSPLIFAPHVLPTDTASNIYIPILIRATNPSAGPDADRFAYVRVRPDGRVVDTLTLPSDDPTPMLRAEGGGVSTGEPLPFADKRAVMTSRWGTVATTHPGRYAIDIPRPGAPLLRIERDIPAIPVEDDERRDRAEAITRDMREVDPTWRWSGPEIPRTKPHVRGLIFAADGRVWVTRSARAERQPPTDTTPGAPDQWIEPTTYDVFEPDGRLLGEVTMPKRTKLHLALGDRIWTVQRDSLDVPSIVRFRLRRDD